MKPSSHAAARGRIGSAFADHPPMPPPAGFRQLLAEIFRVSCGRVPRGPQSSRCRFEWFEPKKGIMTNNIRKWAAANAQSTTSTTTTSTATTAQAKSPNGGFSATEIPGRIRAQSPDPTPKALRGYEDTVAVTAVVNVKSQAGPVANVVYIFDCSAIRSGTFENGRVVLWIRARRPGPHHGHLVDPGDQLGTDGTPGALRQRREQLGQRAVVRRARSA